MKRIIILCLLCTLLLACVPTPEQEYVVNKGDNVLESAIEQNGAGFSVEDYRSTLPKRWEETPKSHRKDISICIDASVLFPDADALPTVEIAPRGNDLDAILWLGEHMADGAYFGKIPVDANGEKLRTRDVILSAIASNNDRIDRAKEMHPEFTEEELVVYREGIARENASLQAEYRNAPDVTIERIDDMSVLREHSMIEIGLFSKSNHRIADVTLVFDPQNPQREQLTIWGGGTDPECIAYWPEPIDDADTAIRCGDQILKELGYDAHYTVANTTEGSVGIGVTYAPIYRGVCYSLGTGTDPLASYEEYFPEDTLELMFVKGTGILRFVQWIGNSRFVRETSENVALLPFDVVQTVVENDLGELLSWTNENVQSRTVMVTEIKLEYKRVRVQNDRKRLLVPAWTVVGTVTDRGVLYDPDTGETAPFKREIISGTLLVINAVDGTLIEFAQMD